MNLPLLAILWLPLVLAALAGIPREALGLTPRGVLRGHALGIVLFLAGFLHLAFGWWTHTVSFTYATARFHEGFWWALPPRAAVHATAVLLLHALGFRAVLPLLVLRAGLSRWRAAVVCAAAWTLGVAARAGWEGAGLAPESLPREFLIAVAAGSLFLATRSLLATAAFEALTRFVPRYILSSAEGVEWTAFYSVPAGGAFRLAETVNEVLVAMLAVGFLLWILGDRSEPVGRPVRYGPVPGARIFAWALGLLAAWTIAIKFVVPAALALRAGASPVGAIWWDFWWVAHLALALALWKGMRFARGLGLAIALAEVWIVLGKFGRFGEDLAAGIQPGWDLMHGLWFVNKVAVLALFVAFALLAALPGDGEDDPPRGLPS